MAATVRGGPLPSGPDGEDPDYLSRQLITCIGNKRALLTPILAAAEEVKRRLGKDRLRVLDAFSGSGVVSRGLKRHASDLFVNDLADYSVVINRCYLSDPDTYPASEVEATIARLNEEVSLDGGVAGFIERLYAPRDDANLTASDRVFYTRENARRLDGYRQLIGRRPAHLQPFLLGPLLSSASIHANTAGVFKGFYKDRATGIGRFGGTGANALSRITGKIVLEPPVLSRFACRHHVFQRDANELVYELEDLDLAYFDPPYNQHPYGSNYFMLDLLAHYVEPRTISPVSGIPNDWRRSAYNSRRASFGLLREILHQVRSRFILLSFNDEGFVTPDKIRGLLREIGGDDVTEFRTDYATFRGSRNLRGRRLRVTEHLFLVRTGR